MHRSAEVVDDGQLGVAITYAQNPVHRSIADDHPVHVSPRTVDTDVKQGCETLAAEKVDSAQVEDHLLRSAGVPCDEASEGLANGGVYVARDGDTYALGCQVVNFEDGAARIVVFRRRSATPIDRARQSEQGARGELLLLEPEAVEEVKRPCSLKTGKAA
jgi:hypothetical protein